MSDADFIVAANKLLRPRLDTDGFEIYSDFDAVLRNENEGNDGAFVKVWVWVENADAVGAYAAEAGTSLVDHYFVEGVGEDSCEHPMDHPDADGGATLATAEFCALPRDRHRR